MCAMLTFLVSVTLRSFLFFFFNDTATTEIYTYGHTRSRHDALPISLAGSERHSFTLSAPAGFTIDGIDAGSLPLPAGVSYVLAGDKSSITFTLPTDSANGAELTVTLDVTNVSATEGAPALTASAPAAGPTTGGRQVDPSAGENKAKVNDSQTVTFA